MIKIKLGDRVNKNNIKKIISYINKKIIKNRKHLYIYSVGFLTGIIFFLFFFFIIYLIKEDIFEDLKLNLLLIFIFLIIIVTLTHLYIKRQKIIELSNTLDELEKEKEIKTALFHLNHEIKNPLAVVNGYLELIENTKKEEKKERYLQIIREEVKRTINIINDFSILGKLKSLDNEPIDLSMVFEDIIEILSPLLKKQQGIINYKNKEEIIILGDYERLKQSFINLIKNSIESKDKDFIIIDIVIKKINKNYKIYIKDNGRGMSKEVLNKIDNNFFTTKTYGTGIGVAYVKKIIEMHNGKIEFKSKEKEETTTIITIPSISYN